MIAEVKFGMGPPGMIVGRFGVVFAPRLPRQAPPAALPSRTRPGGEWAGCRQRRDQDGSAPKALRLVIAALAALLGGREERVQIAARPVQPKTVALQGSHQWPDRPVTHIHAGRAKDDLFAGVVRSERQTVGQLVGSNLGPDHDVGFHDVPAIVWAFRGGRQRVVLSDRRCDPGAFRRAGRGGLYGLRIRPAISRVALRMDSMLPPGGVLGWP